MPKISELTAASALTGTELVPLVQAGTTKRSTVGAMGGSGYYNVKNYGALSDGTNSPATTTAIQAAIDAAGAAGGGVIYFPAGTYIIRPATINIGYAIGLYWPNITLMGDGWNFTHLSFKLYDGSDPATNWPIVAGAVLRGHAFYAPGSNTGPAANPGITLIGLEVDGNAGNTGNRTFPASTVTGDGWDITNQGFRMEADKFHDNVQVIDCWIHSFFGESVYGGGANISNVKIRRCKLGDNNADGVSISSGGDLLVEDNEFYSCFNAATENCYFSGRSVYRNNYIYDCANGAIQAFPASSALVHGTCEIYGNQIYRSGVSQTIYAPGSRNCRIFDNLLVDCTGNNILISSPGGGGSGSDTITADNVEVYNNRMVADQANIDTMIFLGTNASFKPTRLHIHNNIGARTAYGITNGKTIGRCINIDTNGNFFNLGSNCRIDNNLCYGGLADDHSSVIIRNRQIFGAFEENLVSLSSSADFLARLDLSFRVVTGPANLNIRATWTSGTIGAQNVTLMNFQTFQVGYYTVFYEIPAEGATGSNILRFFFNADVSARIFINAKITEFLV